MVLDKVEVFQDKHKGMVDKRYLGKYMEFLGKWLEKDNSMAQSTNSPSGRDYNVCLNYGWNFDYRWDEEMKYNCSFGKDKVKYKNSNKGKYKK